MFPDSVVITSAMDRKVVLTTRQAGDTLFGRASHRKGCVAGRNQNTVAAGTDDGFWNAVAGGHGLMLTDTRNAAFLRCALSWALPHSLPDTA